MAVVARLRSWLDLRGFWRSRWEPRCFVAVALLVAGPPLLLAAWACFIPLPSVLREAGPGDAPGGRAQSILFVDRDGSFLAERRSEESSRSTWRDLDALGETLPNAVIAAEDRRFHQHLGVDPIASARALFTSAWRGRVTGGASTITQQLARVVTGAPRTVRGKAWVMALALRIEASLDKRAILTQYLNRVELGPKVRGAEAAARYYFDKPARDLSLAEAATLASMPRGTAFYDPRRHPDRLLARRDVVIGRMVDLGFASREAGDRARAEPLVLAPRFRAPDAPHLVNALLGGGVDACAEAPPIGGRVTRVETTLDARLQAEAVTTVARGIERLAAQHVSAGAVVVLENETGDVLAYVGSPGLDATLGHNDGVRALRQPGSALKPFVYELAMERFGDRPTTLLTDLETTFVDASGKAFTPRNYDEKFHGPVLLRDALGNSLNVPAVATAERLGPGVVAARLRDLGFCSVKRPAKDYGVAIALGDAEVRLVELANAYATLARGGVQRPVRAARRLVDWEGKVTEIQVPEGSRKLDAARVAAITDILADPAARLASFGAESALELPFEVAAKTGTSKGYRDNVAVGFSSEVTVAVWVGNFDGSPMRDVSGITGAGPIFRDVMRAAMAHRTPKTLPRPGLEEVVVCPLSGRPRGPDCPEGRADKKLRDQPPEATCTMHAHVLVNRADGLLAGPGCATGEDRVVEVYPARLRAWAERMGRPLMPGGASPGCPGARVPERDGLRVVFPEDGAHFLVDPARAENGIVFRVDVPEGAEVQLFVDGVRIGAGRSAPWSLVKGQHRFEARSAGESASVAFVVD